MVNHQHAPNPVSYLNGERVLQVARLEDFANIVNNSNVDMVGALNRMQLHINDTVTVNKKLVQFMNWLAVTNPQILDEFQTTANAFDKLSPREQGDEDAYATAQSV